VTVELFRESGRRVVGNLLTFLVVVADVEQVSTSAEVPVLSVTPPSGTVPAPVAEEIATGVFRFELTPAAAGRYVVTASTTSYGRGSDGFYVDAVTAADGMLTVEEWIGWAGEDNSVSDDESIQEAIDAESYAQRKVIRDSAVYTPDVRSALMRRVARYLAMKRLPLSTPTGDSEAEFIPRMDFEVRRYEAPYRRLPVG
jgi:hypothetical protein